MTAKTKPAHAAAEAAASEDLYAEEARAAQETRRFIESASDLPVAAYGALANILAAFERLLRETRQLVRQADQHDRSMRRLNERLREQYDELKATQARLRQAERMASLSLVVAGVAHEVNTPVGICVTATSHLQQNTDKIGRSFQSGQLKKSDLGAYFKQAGDVADLLATNLQRAAELITSFKQVAVDQTSQKRRRFALATVIAETVKSLGHLFKSGRQTLEVECDEAIAMDSFPGALSQTLINLVMNAHIHAFAETDGGRIRIAASAGANDVTLSVSDNGKGIPARDQAKVFEPFFTTRRGQGGSGLGLHLVYNLVTGPLGGSVELTSAEGRGTCFTLHLPIVAPETPEPAQSET